MLSSLAVYLSSLRRLLELCLAEEDVLAYFGVVLFKLKLTGAGATVLGWWYKSNRCRGALELDLFALWLSHDVLLVGSRRESLERTGLLSSHVGDV